MRLSKREKSKDHTDTQSEGQLVEPANARYKAILSTHSVTIIKELAFDGSPFLPP